MSGIHGTLDGMPHNGGYYMTDDVIRQRGAKRCGYIPGGGAEWLAPPIWEVGRVVYCGGLLNRWSRKRPTGSNPVLPV